MRESLVYQFRFLQFPHALSSYLQALFLLSKQMQPNYLQDTLQMTNPPNNSEWRISFPGKSTTDNEGKAPLQAFHGVFSFFFPFLFYKYGFHTINQNSWNCVCLAIKWELTLPFPQLFFYCDEKWKPNSQLTSEIQGNGKRITQYGSYDCEMISHLYSPLHFFFFSRSSKKKRTLMVSHLCFVYLLWKCWKEVNSESWIPFSGNQNHIKKSKRSKIFFSLLVSSLFVNFLSNQTQKLYNKCNRHK